MPANQGVMILPKLKRISNEKELDKLRRVFLKAETDIINEIISLRAKGNVDYHAVAALNRIQAILKQMETECWKYVPKMIEKQFYVHNPDARRIPEPIQKHIAGYSNAETLTATQNDIVNRLVMNLMGDIIEMSQTVSTNLREALIGRPKDDVYRRAGLSTVANMEAKGAGVRKGAQELVKSLLRNGVTGYTDKAGRRWGLHTYANMVCRTTSRQAEILAVLTADPEHDLYKISAHGTTCPICAPLEGRVYSRSGKDRDFPPLAKAFGKIDLLGPDDLTNSYLNIHPNCWHSLLPWSPTGLSDDELQRIKDFSSFDTNPPTKDPRSQRQIDDYRQKERARAKWLADYRQWERYRAALGDKVPKTFRSFLKHKLADDEKYNEWKEQYRKRL